MTIQEALEVIDRATIPINDGLYYKVAVAKRIIKETIEKSQTSKNDDDREES